MRQKLGEQSERRRQSAVETRQSWHVFNSTTLNILLSTNAQFYALMTDFVLRYAICRNQDFLHAFPVAVGRQLIPT